MFKSKIFNPLCCFSGFGQGRNSFNSRDPFGDSSGAWAINDDDSNADFRASWVQARSSAPSTQVVPLCLCDTLVFLRFLLVCMAILSFKYATSLRNSLIQLFQLVIFSDCMVIYLFVYL